MDFLKKLSGSRKQQSAGEQQATDELALSEVDGELRRTVEQQLGILRFLCTCGKFDSEKVATYFSMAEQIGMQWGPEDKHTMLNATLIAPKLRSDKTVMNGFEQVRVMLIENHVEGVANSIALFTQLLPTLSLDEATAKANSAFLVQVVAELKKLTSSFTQG